MGKNIILSIKNKNGLDFYFSGELSDREVIELTKETSAISVVNMKKVLSDWYAKDFILMCKNGNYYLDDNVYSFLLNEVLNVKLEQMNTKKVIDFIVQCNEKIVYIVNKNGYLFNLIYNDVNEVDFSELEKKGCFIFNNKDIAVKKVAEMLQEKEDELIIGESICFRKLNNVWIEYNERYAEDHHDEDFKSKNIVDKISEYVI